MTDTIFALSSGLTPSGVAVIRMSGPAALGAIEILAGRVPAARTAELRTLRMQDGTVLDRGLVLAFPRPHSVTGEDCAELHVHGGRAVVARALESLEAMPGMRLAEPGEFTRRAFLNGKIDLVQVEALSDLLSAETEAQRRFAVENSGAAQSALYASWRARLLYARAMIEAELDFSDEGDVPGSVSEQVWADVASLVRELREHVAGFGRAEIIRDGFRVVLAGPPNAGKSSLINALARRDIAIVSPEPGTTRDVIEVALDLGGVKVIVADTAGLREDAAGIEALGIERTRARMEEANLILAVQAYGEMEGTRGRRDAENRVAVVSKIDLAGVIEREKIAGLRVSAKSGEGIAELIEFVARKALASAGGRGDVLPSRLRHVACFAGAAENLDTALDEQAPLELRAESLRLAGYAVGRVIGSVDAEDLLGAIFSQFCIGK